MLIKCETLVNNTKVNFKILSGSFQGILNVRVIYAKCSIMADVVTALHAKD